MSLHRFAAFLVFVSSTTSYVACGGTVASATTTSAPETGIDAGDDVQTLVCDGSLTDAGDPLEGVDPPDGSPRVRVGVVAVADPGMTKEGVAVAFALSVTDGDAPLAGIEVRGGPAGRMIAMNEDKYDPGSYAGYVEGYESSWEFLVERAGTPLWHVVLGGPSFPSTTFAAIPPSTNSRFDAATITWSPACEPGVRVEACATGTTHGVYASPPTWCVEGSDGGSIVLRTAEETGKASMFFPPSGEYGVQLSKAGAFDPNSEGEWAGAWSIEVTVQSKFDL